MTPTNMESPSLPRPILSVRNLTLSYVHRRPFESARPGVIALQDVSLELFAGKTTSLVGPSGSGKSSLARCILFLERPSAGQILYQDVDLSALDRKALKQVRREVHLILQDSASALNPGLTVEEILVEPLVIHRIDPHATDIRKGIREVMQQTELPEKWMSRRPLELSGGQRQRVAIARSLLLQPRVLILDEALSALDLSAQGHIANLLLALQAEYQLALLFITHDASMASLLGDEILVMDAGRIVRRGSPSDVFPAHQIEPSHSLPGNTVARETLTEALTSARK